MKKFTLKNVFHDTQITILVPEYDAAEMDAVQIWSTLQSEAFYGDTTAKRKIRKISKRLCGIKDCTCGTVRMI